MIVRGWFLAVLSSGVLLITSCSSSHGPKADGQSHWLRDCVKDADCGGLSCVCGICSSTCENDSTCSTTGKNAVCRGAKELPDTTACSKPPHEISLCLLTCEHDNDCRAGGHGLACRQSVCLAPTRPVDDAGAGVITGAVEAGAGHDAGTSDRDGAVRDSGTDSSTEAAVDARVDADVADASPPVPTGPLEFDCSNLVGGDLPGSLEVIDIADPNLALAASGDSVFGSDASESSTASIWQFPDPDGPKRELVRPGGMQPGPFAADGTDFFYAIGDDLGTLTKLSLVSGKSVNLFADYSIHALSIVPHGDRVFWLGYDGSQAAYLMRTDRQPGATVMLTSVPVYGSELQLIGNTFYFLGRWQNGASLEQMQLYTSQEDGGPAEPFGPPGGIQTLANDGRDLFAGVASWRDELDNPQGEHGVGRVNLEDGTVTMLFAGPDEDITSLQVDRRNLYWMTNRYGPDGKLWRARKDGSGEAELLAHGWAAELGPVLTSSFVYWIVDCDPHSYLVRLPK